jgi:polyferredoxin
LSSSHQKLRRTPARIRRLIAYALLALFVAALLYPASMEEVLQILPKLQFGQLTAAMMSNGSQKFVVIVSVMSVLTLLFGRFFCAGLCPMGALMDMVSLLRGVISKQKFAYKPAKKSRMIVPFLVLILLWLGLNIPFGLLEPYSLFVSKSLFYPGPSILLFAVIILAACRGRAFCNSLCPAGFILRILSSATKYHLKFDQNQCLRCGVCSQVCRTSAIDGNEQNIDRSRCVLCLDCLSVCPNRSLTWGTLPPASLPLRRPFLHQLPLVILAAGTYLTPASIRAKSFYPPKTAPVLPPGALSLAHLNAHCSLCHSCIIVCPNEVLIPSGENSPSLWARPVLNPYNGFCQYDCTLCTTICPTGALIGMTVEEKHISRLGMVYFEREECVVIKNRTSCGACAEMCPTGAVRMITGLYGDEEPDIKKEFCIGCGACQNVCPVRPFSAIRVQGLLVQQTAVQPVKVESEDLTLNEDFPF